jgi:hypothetical protein
MNDDPEFVTFVAKAIYEASPRVRPFERLSAFKREGLKVEARAAIAAVNQRFKEQRAKTLQEIGVTDTDHIGFAARLRAARVLSDPS